LNTLWQKNCGFEDVQVLLNGSLQGYVVVRVIVPEAGGADPSVLICQTAVVEQPRNRSASDSQDRVVLESVITAPTGMPGFHSLLGQLDEAIAWRS
jgi:hypothetical protein